MKLSIYDGKLVRIIDKNDVIYEGQCIYDHHEYCMHEFGVDEEALEIDNYLFYESEIKEIEVIEEKREYIWQNRIVHRMKLAHEPFGLVYDGVKTIELRLYDEKRQKVKIGDVIRFEDIEDDTEVVYLIVEDIYIFDSFKELYENLPLTECGYTEENVANASWTDMNKYYSEEMQKKYKVVGFKLR